MRCEYQKKHFSDHDKKKESLACSKQRRKHTHHTTDTKMIPHDSQDLQFVYNQLCCFFRDKEHHLGKEVLNDDENLLAKVADALRNKVRARLLPSSREDFKGRCLSLDGGRSEERDFVVPLMDLVNQMSQQRQRMMADGEESLPHIPCDMDPVFCMELAPSCQLPRMPPGCQCGHINDGSIKEMHDGDEEDIASGYDFRRGHILFARKFEAYRDCTLRAFKQALQEGAEGGGGGGAEQQWLAEMLVMQACLLCAGREQDGGRRSTMCLLPEKSYAENENCFKLNAFFYVCDEESSESSSGSGEDGNKRRAHFLLTFGLRVSRDGRLVKISHCHYGCDGDAEEGCKCRACCCMEMKK